jgi:HlyD family secretion protein
MRTRSWVATAVVALAAAGGGFWWWQAHQEAAAAPVLRFAKIERGSLAAAVSSSGTVSPVSQVIVGTQVSGQIKEMLADFNTEVKKGQPIARLDPESFDYKVRQATADVEAARAAVLNAQANAAAVQAGVAKARLDADNAARDLARTQDLLARQFVSQAEFERARNVAGTLGESLKVAQAQAEVARAQVASAQAVVRQREAALAQARVDLERTEIRSPVDGVVIKRSVDVGQTVAASLQAPELFVIARNLSDMQVEAAIDEADIARVRPGQKVTFTIDAFPGRSFEGSVRQVRKAAVSAQNVVTYTAVIAFANPGSLLLPGMTANVRIVTDTRADVLKVPNAALRVRIPGVEPPADAASAPAGAPSAPRDVAAAPAAAGGAAGGPGGALREFRERLAKDLELTPEQLAKVDAISADLRPRFAELRSLPEDERPKARERILGDMRARIAEQLSDAQKPRYLALLAELGGRQAVTRGRLYRVGEGGKPVALSVRLGISDGVSTELIVAPNSPQAAVLKEGAEIIVAAQFPAAATTARPATGPRPPF